LFFGGNVDIEQKFPMTIIQVADQPRLVLEKKDSGEIAVNLDIFDSDPKPRIIASIEHNEFTVNPNNYFKVIKSADKSRLVVVDQYKTTVLDVRYTNKQSMSINAVLHFPGVPDPLVIGDNEIMWRNSPIYANCSHDFGAGTPVIDILPTKSLATSASAGLTLR
jgi:hypothetical protein